MAHDGRQDNTAPGTGPFPALPQPANFHGEMPTPIAEFIFWAAAAVVVVAQLLILRSTRRGMRLGPPGSASALEWAFAIVPAICLLGLLVWTWHTMHAGTVNFQAKTPPAGVNA